jgi:DNA-binding transcriptional LysR family regulator
MGFMIDRRLHVLRMVRQHGTVTAAARALHLTPSAVSQQVRALARDLDVALLQPAGRGVRLTPAADILLDHADRLYVGWEQAQADLHAHRHGDRGPLRICGFPSALSALLPAAATRLRQGRPPLHLHVVQADPAESLDLLVAGEVHLAIIEASLAAPATTDERFAQELLFDDPLRLIVPFEHRLAQRDEIALADAVDEDWVGGPVDGSYHQIERLACGAAGFTPRFVHRALDWSAYLAVVGAGLGVALLPRLAVPRTGQVRSLHLTDTPLRSRRVLTCVRRGSQDHPAIRRLREALQQSSVRRDGATAS